MKIINKKTVEEEIELRLPAFVKFGEHYSKIINSKKIITVNNYSFHKSISIEQQFNPFGNEGWQFIAEEIFDEIFENVLKELKQLSPQRLSAY